MNNITFWVVMVVVGVYFENRLEVNHVVAPYDTHHNT